MLLLSIANEFNTEGQTGNVSAFDSGLNVFHILVTPLPIFDCLLIDPVAVMGARLAIEITDFVHVM